MNKNLILNITERKEHGIFIVNFTVNFAFKDYRLFEIFDGIKYFLSEINQLFYDCKVNDLFDLPLYQLDIYSLQDFEDIYTALKDTFLRIRTFQKIGFEIVDDVNGEIYENKI